MMAEIFLVLISMLRCSSFRKYVVRHFLVIEGVSVHDDADYEFNIMHIAAEDDVASVIDIDRDALPMRVSLASQRATPLVLGRSRVVMLVLDLTLQGLQISILHDFQIEAGDDPLFFEASLAIHGRCVDHDRRIGAVSM